MGGPAPWQAWVAAGALVGYWVLTSATNRWVPEAYMVRAVPHITLPPCGRMHRWPAISLLCGRAPALIYAVAYPL